MKYLKTFEELICSFEMKNKKRRGNKKPVLAITKNIFNATNPKKGLSNKKCNAMIDNGLSIM